MGVLINNVVKIVFKSNLGGQQRRFYPRWSHRRPLKVYSAEEYDEIEKSAKNEPGPSKLQVQQSSNVDATPLEHKVQDCPEPLRYKIKPNKVVQPLVATNQRTKVKKTAVDMLETVIDGEGNFVYTKMKNNDSRIGNLLTEVKSKKGSNKKGLILLEGKRLIKDALQSGCYLKYILFSRKDEMEFLKPYLPKLGASLYKMPYRELQMWSDLTTNPGIMGIFKTPVLEDFVPKRPLPVTVICDNIREPGNLGSILRVCAGVGCAKVILSKGCVNLWDTKVLRSSVGAHFKLSISQNVEWKIIENMVESEANFFIADNKIANDEGHTDVSLTEILKQVPVLPYYSVNFQSFKHTVVIVGGETYGLSRNSYELVQKTAGARLNIPLTNDVDSLNVGAALGIIVFEVRKQLLQKIG